MVKMNPAKGGIAVPENQPKPSENGVEKAKEHFEEFNNKEATTIKRVKIALPDSESPIIEIPDGPVAVEYRSPKETKNPNQVYRHEIKHTPPQANIGFVKGKPDEGDCILIYGKGIKIDDWMRG